MLRIVPDQHAAVVLMTNASTGRAMYRSLFAEVMELVVRDQRPAAAPRPVAWRSRRTLAVRRRLRMAGPAGGGHGCRDCLLIKSEHGETEAFPLDQRTFLVDAEDPDTPTVTFGAYDAAGRPGVLYDMLWGLPRLDE